MIASAGHAHRRRRRLPKGPDPSDWGKAMAEQKAKWDTDPGSHPALDLGSLHPEFLDPPQNPFYSYPVGAGPHARRPPPGPVAIFRSPKP